MKTAHSVYLTFNGNCRQSFAFYQKVFAVKADWTMTVGESPDKDTIPKEYHDRIIHMSIALKVGGSSMHLMGSDYIDTYCKKKFVQGTNFQIALTPSSKQEADELYAKLAEGGSADHPMKDMFWCSYHGCLTDPFGIQWMLDVPSQQQQPPSDEHVIEVLTDTAAELGTLAAALDNKKKSTAADDDDKSKQEEK